jgi:FK506-binding nuclear protein
MPLMKLALMSRWILPTWLVFLATRMKMKMKTLGWSLDCSLRLSMLTVSPRRRFEEIASEEEAEVQKSAKRPRESNTTEQGAPTGDKLSKKAKKKLKAENGAAVPVPTVPDAEASKKSKKDKKAKKGEDTKEDPPKPGEDKESESKQKQGDKGDMQELPSGLKIQDHKPGEGPQAKKGARVSMRYIGKLTDGNGKIFDSNTKGKPVRVWAAV